MSSDTTTNNDFIEAREQIEIKNLYKIFGGNEKAALKLVKKGASKEEILEKTGATLGVVDASFSINEGEIFVVMGLSGSGKSTLLRMLNLLVKPSSGEILIDNQDITKVTEEELRKIRREKISMVFQSFALLPHLTVLDNVRFGLDIAGIDKSEGNKKALAVLEDVGLQPYADSYPAELSGGMQQRVGLARALAVEPDILLMDEAFSALDPLIRSEMQDELLRLQKEHQRTIIFISHDLDEALKIGDRIAIMQDGEVVQVGSPEEILRNPANDYVKAFFNGVDTTSTLSVADIVIKNQTTLIRHKGDGLRAALQRLIRHDRDYGYVVSRSGEFIAMIKTETLQDMIDDIYDDGSPASLENAYMKDVPTLNENIILQDILPTLTQYSHPIPVVNDLGKFKGVVSKNIFLKSLHKNHMED